MGAPLPSFGYPSHWGNPWGRWKRPVRGAKGNRPDEAPFFIGKTKTVSEASKSVPARGLQIGADFGPGHTGVALLDGGNAVLAREVLAHRTDVSDSLKSRRESRALRRRAKSRKARLRNFRALLAEMGIPPRPDRPPEFVGNRLYALAHRRGWDYSTLEELLADESGDQPRETETVRLADDLLKEKVPPQRLEALDGPARSPEIRKKQEEAAEILKAGKRPEGLFRHVKLRETCLGEFAALLRAAREAEDGDDEDAAAQNREAAERLREKLRTLKGVPEWLDERLDIVFGGEAPAEARAEMRGHILALLGLENRRAAFESGIDYRPHNSRRRGKALEELEEILKDNGLGEWLPRARAVLNRQLRKKRFKNRAPGKCVACGLNLPLRVKVRRLLFEIEALQMRVRPDGEAPNLRPEETAELLRLVNFRKGKIRDREKWAEFFARFPKPPRKTDDEDDEPRTKPAQLRAVAEGPMEGRVPGLCRNCLMKKAALLKIPRDDRGGEWREKWNALSGERVLGLQDAAPSLRQKVERVCARVARMLKDAGFPNPREAPVARIGVERAAFDIVAASSASGRRPKKSEYGKKRRHGPAELLRQQGGLCIYCGTPPGANLTVDHFVPRASGGGDSHKNRLAACMACNIQKGNLGGIQFAPDALAALRESDPDKADHLEKNKGKLSADNLSAPQQTMLGVKILRGELARLVFGETALAADKKKFPVIRARDAAALRRFWFPQIARKKAALRAENSDNALVVRPGEKPKRVSGKIDPAQDRPEFVREESGKIVIAPREGQDHEGVYNLQLEEVREWKIPSGRPLEINLKEKKIRGRLAAVNGKDPAAPGLPVQWEIQDRILTLRARTRTVARLVFTRRLRIVVPPKKDAPVRKYHHAVDAVVVAADKKWDQIVRLARDPDRRTARAKKLLNASGRPKGPLAADAAPPDDSDPWLVEDKPDKSGPKRPRFKANPVRRARAHRFPKGGGEARETAEFTRRVPLDKLGRKRIPAIPDSAAAIREALDAAWREIDQMPPEERQNSVAKIPGGDEAIAAAWLLKRPPGHFLHHKRVRSAPVKVSPGPPFPLRRTVAGREHTHLFWCESPLWSETAVWEEKTPKGKTVLKISRRRPAFYRPGSPFPHKPKPPPREGDLPEWENGPPPEDAIRLRPGMKIRIQGEPGLWRIVGLEDRRAQVFPADGEARRFAENAPETAQAANLLWTGRKVRRPDLPGLWRVADLHEQTGLEPDGPEAEAAGADAPEAVNFKRLTPADPAEDPPVGQTVRRIGTTAPPGIWRIEKSAGKGKAVVVPHDDSARRAARNAKKRTNYAALRRANP